MLFFIIFIKFLKKSENKIGCKKISSGGENSLESVGEIGGESGKTFRFSININPVLESIDGVYLNSIKLGPSVLYLKTIVVSPIPLSASCAALIVVTPAATIRRDLHWITSHIPDDAQAYAIDMTVSESVLVVMGPQARQFLQPLIPQSLENDDFAFGTMQPIEFGHAVGRAHRVTYVGELGWELYIPADMSAHVFETLMARRAEHPMALCGLHALDSCRIEKAFRHFGHDISNEDHVLEAGLGFAVKEDKPAGRFGGMIGADAVRAKRNDGLAQRFMQFRLKDPQPLLYHNEAILRDGELIGYLTSGNYGHHLGAAIGLGYVKCAAVGETAQQQLQSNYQIDVAGQLVDAEVSFRPMYDPKALQIRL